MCAASPSRCETADSALTGCDAVIHSTVPVESGLSSSAALECALATMFEALGGWSLTPERKALLCQKAENEFVGVKCGILDQYSSCLGREGCALLLDCPRPLYARGANCRRNSRGGVQYHEPAQAIGRRICAAKG